MDPLCDVVVERGEITASGNSNVNLFWNQISRQAASPQSGRLARICDFRNAYSHQRTVLAPAICRASPSYSFSLRYVTAAVDNPKAVRAVGATNGRHPVAIIVPCHRIIGSGGRAKLTGYGGGLWRKEWLPL